jgi:hypothetical protein
MPQYAADTIGATLRFLGESLRKTPGLRLAIPPHGGRFAQCFCIAVQAAKRFRECSEDLAGDGQELTQNTG